MNWHDLAGDEGDISNVWTADWHKRTLKAEMLRLQSPNVRLLVVSLFIDKTHLDVLGRNTACPILVTLLNFTLEVLASDGSKKLAGFFPDVHLTDAQKRNSKILLFMRDLYFYVSKCFIDGLNAMYDEGGIEWIDTSGEVWHLVPVLSFISTDLEEAKKIKGLYKGPTANRPCQNCTITYAECDKVPDELHYRNAEDLIGKIKQYQNEKR
jgi:hypothetical protein